MGFLKDIFKRNDDFEPDDVRELREYEENVYDAGSGASAFSEFLVDDTFSIKATGRVVVVGTVTAGKFSVGDDISIIHNGSAATESKILGIEKFRKTVNYAAEGEKVGLLLSGLSHKDISRNDIIKK